MTDPKRNGHNAQDEIVIVPVFPADADDGREYSPREMQLLDDALSDVLLSLPPHVSEETFRQWQEKYLIPSFVKRADRGLLHDCPP